MARVSSFVNGSAFHLDLCVEKRDVEIQRGREIN